MNNCSFDPNKKITTEYDIQCLKQIMLPIMERMGINREAFLSIKIEFIDMELNPNPSNKCAYIPQLNVIDIQPGIDMQLAIRCLSHEVGHAILKTGAIRPRGRITTEIEKRIPILRTISEASAMGTETKFGKEFARQRGIPYEKPAMGQQDAGQMYRIAHAISPVASAVNRLNIKDKFRHAPVQIKGECIKCGFKYKEGDKFCYNCGAPIPVSVQRHKRINKTQYGILKPMNFNEFLSLNYNRRKKP